MTPIQHFDSVWQRCDHLNAIHAYINANTTVALQPDELLRAQWVARVSAFDLFIHEKVAQGMLQIFDGLRPACPAYSRFHISSETLERIRKALTPSAASAAFDFEVRSQIGRKTYQFPDDVADGLRLCSGIDLWKEIAARMTVTTVFRLDPKDLKADLTRIVDRRNKIAHEGDLQPTIPREPWPIDAGQVQFVSSRLDTYVRIIDTLI